MAGFCLSYSKQPVHKAIYSNSKLVCSEITLDGWHIGRQTLPKFENHKFFIDAPSFFFSTDGVILNRDELLEAYHCTEFSELVGSLYRQQGETFFRCFRGSFSGVFYDKGKQLMLVFADQTGSRLLFWEQEKETVLISSDVWWLIAQKRDLQWDEFGLYELLTYGYMPSHHTIVDSIRRIPAGCYLRIKGGSCEQLQYHRFSNTSLRRTEKEEIQGVDKLFRQAVQRVLNVNTEYGYSNLFPLSAGLDSRMVTWVAHCLSEQPIENFTYGFPEEQDVTVARRIAKELSHEWHFISQKGNDFLSHIDQSVKHSGMQICYAGIAEATDAFNALAFESAGVIPTGVGGDDILSSPLNRSTRHYQYGECALSTIRYSELNALIPKEFYSQYATRNIFYLYARTFECHAMGSPLAFQSLTESYSPYMDVDFLEFIFSIPERHRANYRLYDQWILHCYPEAAQWKHNGKTIGKRIPELHIFHRHIPFGSITKHIVAFLLKRLHIRDLYQTAHQNQYARTTEPYWQQYIEDNKHYLSGCGKIAAHIEAQLKSANIQDKMQALTVLAAIKAARESYASKG